MGNRWTRPGCPEGLMWFGLGEGSVEEALRRFQDRFGRPPSLLRHRKGEEVALPRGMRLRRQAAEHIPPGHFVLY